MTDFPVYRRYRGLDVWFKILSDEEFIEVKRVGKKWQVSTITAKVYPEFVLIADMISNSEGRWEPAEADRVEEIIRNLMP